MWTPRRSQDGTAGIDRIRQVSGALNSQRKSAHDTAKEPDTWSEPQRRSGSPAHQSKRQAGDARITDAILTPRTDMRRTALAVHTNSR